LASMTAAAIIYFVDSEAAEHGVGMWNGRGTLIEEAGGAR